MTDSPPSPLPPPIVATTKPAKSRVGAIVLALVTLVLVVVVATVGTAPYWAPALLPVLPWTARASEQQNDLDDRIGALEQRTGNDNSITARLVALEHRPASDAGAAVVPLQGQLGELQARLDRDEATLSRLTKDQSSSGESAERVLIVALANLGNAVASSRPFATELSSVEALSQSRPGWAASLKPLEDSAKTGIPGVAVLAQRFSDTAAPAILRAEASGPTSAMSFTDAMLARLRGLIVIRRVDGPTGSGRPVDAAVATADAALSHGDLAGAVASLDNLSGAPAQAAAPWLKDAHQRLQAEESIAKLTQQASSDLAAGASGG